MSDSVDFSHDPVPTNDSEQLLFPQYFETLVRLDCKGRPRPGLANWWSTDPTGRVWTFVLPLETAPRVVSSWQAHEAAVRELGIESAAVSDSNLLIVTLSQPSDSTLELFADPALAVAWGPSGPPPTVAHFRIEPNSDPRDALDHGADLVVSRDPALVDYVAGRPDFAAVPLPWSRTYVLLQPPTVAPLELAGAMGDRRSLARDAVNADARAAGPPFWWTDANTCPVGGYSASNPASSRVVYRRGDDVARDLAERIVALSGAGAGLRAAAVEPADFSTLLRNGSERAYVLALPRQTLAPCRESAPLPGGARILPLIDTRANAIVRKGAPPLTVDWDGTVRVAPR